MVPLFSDLKTANRLVKNLLRSRRNRRNLQKQLDARSMPDLGSLQIGVYFSDTSVNLYQMRQWYAPLVELSKIYPVVVISRSPGAMLKLMEECPLPVVYLRKIIDFENFLGQQKIKLMLYVNQNTKNFQAMRYGRMWHVFINHGESDKAYMSSNQYKAYDYAMIAGQAAADRLQSNLWDYDVDSRALVIGRPQADHFVGDLPYVPDERTVVLYAPTWEGDRESMSYGSVLTHGVTLAKQILADPGYRLIYRPHPRSGVSNPEYGVANREIITAISEANRADTAAHHIYDDGPTVGWQLTAADVAITDVSAMVYDRLATGRPLIVTRPASPLAEVEERGYLGSAEWIRVEDAKSVVEQVQRVQNDSESLERLNHWVHYHFGDTTPGAATARFHAAVAKLMSKWHEHAAMDYDDSPQVGLDDFDGEEDDAPPGD